MKSLSILLLAGIFAALIIGGIFAINPVFAEKPVTAAPKGNLLSVKPVAPLTGEAESVSTDSVTGTNFFSTTFEINLNKDAKAARLQNFVAAVSNGKASQVTGIYLEDVLAFPVVHQNGNAAYVSMGADEVTQFGMAADYGSTAFLAHNYLAGATFFQLSEGQVITLVYGDGNTADFQIQSIRRFQALSPNSTQSTFVDLDSNQKLSAADLFYSVYNSDNPVVLQTCIEKDGVSSWGRLFVIAVPLS
ncbi:MAG TPA: hypothetical protein VI451_00790 [Anaerolineales bacterium]|nr:hypothetical protein [Anaerolineales bacterium]